MPDGKWFHSRVYEDVNVAIEVGHAADFWDLEPNAQALLIARCRVKGTIEAYEDKLHTDDLKKTRSKGRSPGRRGGR